jgi:hypothetical protein
MIKTLNEQINDYVQRAILNLQTDVWVHEVQREFAVSWAQARDILDRNEDLIYNKFTGGYVISPKKEEQK